MSDSLISSYQFYTKQTYAICGIFLISTGILGELFNLIIFSTLKTFRKSPSIIYLRLMSCSNLGQIIIAVLVRTFNNGFQINLLRITWGCKFREFFVHYFALISFTCICLATIEQYLSLNRPARRETNARRNIVLVLILWLIHNIPFLVFCDMVSTTCTNLSPGFSKYANYFIWPVLLGCLPIVIMLIFSLLAFAVVRQHSLRQRDSIRLSHDRQITAMVLVYVLFIILLSLPCILFSIYQINPPYINAEISARNRLIYSILSFFYYESYACSFYIYCCVSKRFRKQVLYVLLDIHLQHWKQLTNRFRPNRVANEAVDLQVQQNNTHDLAIY